MSPLYWSQWLRAWRRIWWVHFWNWRATKDIAAFDHKTLAIVAEVIRDYAPDSEIIHNDRGVYHCDDCSTAESLLARTHANQSKPHDYLCATCFFDRLLLELSAK